MLTKKTIGLIGTGNLGEAIVHGLIQSEKVTPAQIIATDKREERLLYIAETYNVKVLNSNIEVVQMADIILLSVKPKDLQGVLREITPSIDKSKILVSTVAGVTTSFIRQNIPHSISVVRVMPNTAVLVMEGAIGLYAGDEVSLEEKKLAMAIFESVGIVVEVESENLMDAVTGLSGSGPAYIFLIIEAMVDEGVKMGLSREAARRLSMQTVLGAATMAIKSGKNLSELKEMVTSPGGTTIVGLEKLEECGVRSGISKAINAAANKAKEISK